MKLVVFEDPVAATENEFASFVPKTLLHYVQVRRCNSLAIAANGSGLCGRPATGEGPAGGASSESKV